jgi:hypothetical protein
VIRKYCTVHPEIWITKPFRKISPDCKLLAIYLRTCPQFQMVGIFNIPIEIMAKDTGLAIATVEDCLGQLEAIEYLKFDFEADVVWVIDMAVSQVSRGTLSENQWKGVNNELTRLYEDEFPFVEDWIHRHGGRYGVTLNNLNFVTD